MIITTLLAPCGHQGYGHETRQIGVGILRNILVEGKLYPEKIIIRDYRIGSANFAVCPETTRTVGYRIHFRHLLDPTPAAALANEIVQDLFLPITSIEMRAVDYLPPSRDCIPFLWATQTHEPRALSCPEI